MEIHGNPEKWSHDTLFSKKLCVCLQRIRCDLSCQWLAHLRWLAFVARTHLPLWHYVSWKFESPWKSSKKFRCVEFHLRVWRWKTQVSGLYIKVGGEWMLNPETTAFGSISHLALDHKFTVGFQDNNHLQLNRLGLLGRS